MAHKAVGIEGNGQVREGENLTRWTSRLRERISTLRRYRPGKLAANTVAAAIWQGIRVALQALWVLVIARILSPESYGDFAGLTGLATTLGGLCGLGLGLVMYQKVARDLSSFGPYWHKASRLTLSTGILFTTCFLPIAWHLNHRHLGLASIAAISAAELIFFPIVTLCAFAFAAHEKAGYAAGMPALMSASRLAAALCFWIAPIEHSLAAYSFFHLCGSALGAMATLAFTTNILRPMPVRLRVTGNDLREGIGFSALWGSSIALTSLDKFFVLQFSGSSVAGLYAATYRFMSIVAQPMDALIAAAAPRLFRRANTDKEKYKKLLSLLAVTVGGYAIVAGVLLIHTAELLPILLGTAFTPAVVEVRWMALMLPLYGLRLLGTNVLMTSGRKSIRLAIEIAGLLTMFALGAIWIPHFGLRGAIMMAITTEATLMTLAWLSIRFDTEHGARTNVAQR